MKCGKNKKVAHEPPRRVGHSCSYHIMTSTVYLTEQTTAKCYLFVLDNKNVKIFAKISFVVR